MNLVDKHSDLIQKTKQRHEQAIMKRLEKLNEKDEKNRKIQEKWGKTVENSEAMLEWQWKRMD